MFIFPIPLSPSIPFFVCFPNSHTHYSIKLFASLHLIKTLPMIVVDISRSLIGLPEFKHTQLQLSLTKCCIPWPQVWVFLSFSCFLFFSHSASLHLNLSLAPCFLIIYELKNIFFRPGHIHTLFLCNLSIRILSTFSSVFPEILRIILTFLAHVNGRFLSIESRGR